MKWKYHIVYFDPNIIKKILCILRVSDQMVQWHTGECSLLEDLFCPDCWDLKHLRVSRAVKLKVIGIRLPVEGIETLEIVVPSFQQLTFLFLGGRKDHA